MNVVECVKTGAEPTELFDLVADLSNYPSWLGLVVRADPVDSGDDTRPCWVVELRGRIGPLARSKRLRMVRTRCDRPEVVRFERVESDDRNHSDWILEASIDAHDDGSMLTMSLHYGGSRFAPVLTPILREEIRKGRGVLQDHFPV